ncbi:MAG: hypothetical protein NVSMB27_12140 [Ktedonobacteraceae bacterium]
MTRRVHGAHHLLEQVGADMLVLVDAGITSGGLLEHAREKHATVLGALEAGAWEHLDHQRRLGDGSVLAWVPPTRKGQAQYPVQRGMWAGPRFGAQAFGFRGDVGISRISAISYLCPQIKHSESRTFNVTNASKTRISRLQVINSL